MQELSELGKNKSSNYKNAGNIANPIVTDGSILSYYTNPNKYDEVEIFDRAYEQALVLMCGDRLLKSASTINSVIIRKTSTQGVYKIILTNPNSGYKIIHLDECELVNDRKYCKGTISQNGENSFEVTYFDDDDEIVIEYYSKEEVIEFMKKNKLIFQN